MGEGLKNLKCVCGEGIDAPGGLIFVPEKKYPSRERKLHVCVSCAGKIGGILDFSKATRGNIVATYKTPPVETREDGTMLILSKGLSRYYMRKIRALLEK